MSPNHPARHGGAHHQDRFRRQDLFHDIVEGKVSAGSAGTVEPDRQGAPIPGLRHGICVDFCRHVTFEAGAIVRSVIALYTTPNVDHQVRFCFCKKKGRGFGGCRGPFAGFFQSLGTTA